MSAEPALSIEQACRVILGNKLAESIIEEQGVHWAVVAATMEARTSDDPRALAAIRKWRADAKAESRL
jgi:hypothetical protein